MMLCFHAKIVTRVPFFYGKDINLILQILPNLQPISYEKGEFIYKEGDYAEESFINYF